MLDYHHRFGIQVMVARAVNHLGGGQSPQFVFSDWCRQIALAEAGLKKPTLDVGNLKVQRDFLHVDDVTQAYQIIMKKGKAGQIYNVSSGKTECLEGFLEYLRGQATVPISVRVLRSKIRRGEPLKTKVNSDKIRLLGWKPQKTIMEALQDLLEFWRLRVPSGRGN